MLSRIHERFGIAKARRRALLVLCLALGAAGWVNAAGAPAELSKGSSKEFNSSFAIADFDGDLKPDLATVEIQKGSSASNTRYSIRLQLTAGAAQVFGVIAPAGGLQIVARDVNGDDALDVLISTVWQHTEVAVLLNDGHGRFTLADPGAFPAAFWGSGGDWSSGTLPLCDSTVLVRSEHPSGEVDLESEFGGPPISFECAHKSAPAGLARIPLFSLLGRAPPRRVFPS